MRYYDANLMAIRDAGNEVNDAKNNDINAIPCASSLSLTDDMKSKIRAKTSEKNIEKNN